MEQDKKELCTERLHLFAPNIYIGIKGEIRGITEIADLEKAIERIISKVEVLHQRIVLDDSGKAYYEPCKPRKSIFHTQKDFTTVVNITTKKGMDIWNGELIHFYIREEKDTVELMIVAHHLVGDGQSILLLLELILKELNRQKIDVKPLVVLKPKDFPKASEMFPFERRYLTHLNQKWMKKRDIYSMQDCKKIHQAYIGRNSCEIYEATVEKEDLDYILQQAKRIGVTVNTFITTVAIKTYEKKAVTGMAVSIRNQRDKSICNAASGLSITYQYDKNKTFAANARKIEKRIKDFLGRPYRKYFALRFQSMMNGSFLDGAAMYKYLDVKEKKLSKLAALMNYDDHPRDLGITNLTRANISSLYGKYRLDHISFVAPVVPYSERIIGVVTFGDEMSLTMQTVAEDKEAERRFFERLIQNLKNKEFETE